MNETEKLAAELAAEREELNKLINKGLSFELTRKVRTRRPGILGRFSPPAPSEEHLKFNIEEPTLSTLDRIASEQIDLSIDENIISSENGMQEARRLAHQHARRLSRIIAYAVLGQDYVIASTQGGRTKYRYDEQRFNELTELFYNNIQPSKLFQLVLLINTISNLGDFMNSIRLMSASRTTMPIRVEAEQKD